MKLNEKIIKLRKEKGLSQEEFGSKINVSRQAVSKWESEQTKPDVDKIKEISKKFDVSYDYLLNDEIEQQNNLNTKLNEKNKTKTKGKILKIIFAIVLIYLLISLYKFIALYRYYNIANSFSEENYMMSSGYEGTNQNNIIHTIVKVGNTKIQETKTPYDEEKSLKDEEGQILPNRIEYLDSDKDVCYYLTRDMENDYYQYFDQKEEAVDEEELKNLMDTSSNDIKENTLGIIPSDFKTILLYSANPMCSVNIMNNEIYVNDFGKVKRRIILNKDGLVEKYSVKTEFDGEMNVSYSYDYVQDHFTKIQDPLEKYSNMIKK